MKLLSTVAAGALLLAGCAPFEHGHYADDVHFINELGDPPGTPLLLGAGYSEPYYEEAIEPAHAYSEPAYSAPAPVAEVSYAAPVQFVQEAPAPVQFFQEAPRPVQVVHQAPPIQVVHQQAPPPVSFAPVFSAPPIAKPIHVVSVAPPPPPIVAATTVSVEEERYIGETVYAPPSVINAPPVYMRGPGQFSNQPFPDPPYPSFGTPGGFGFAQSMPQGFGFPPPAPGYGNPFSSPLAANMRPGYGNPYAMNGCVTSCSGPAPSTY